MFIDGINFDSKWVATMNQQDFLAVMAKPGYWHLYFGDPKRAEKLAKAHELCCQVEGVTYEVEKPAIEAPADKEAGKVAAPKGSRKNQARR